MANYVSYNDIIKAATMRLNKSFTYPVYASEVVEGYEAPCFFIDLLPVSTTYETANIAETSLILTVTFFNHSNNGIENRLILLDLRRAFGLKLQVGDRYLNIQESNVEMVGDAVDSKYMSTISFDITYREDISEKAEHDIAGNINITLSTK